MIKLLRCLRRWSSWMLPTRRRTLILVRLTSLRGTLMVPKRSFKRRSASSRTPRQPCPVWETCICGRARKAWRSLFFRRLSSSRRRHSNRFLLGSAYNRLCRYQDALAELQAALRLGGNESEVYYHLARSYGGLGRQEDRRTALARFAELSKKSKEDAEAQRQVRKLVEQAKSLVDSGDLCGALARREEARELRPSDHTVLFRLASLNYDLERYDVARDYAQEAVALTPSEWLYHFLFGLIESRTGHWHQARISLEVAVRLNPSAADAYNALGEVARRGASRNVRLPLSSAR